MVSQLGGMTIKQPTSSKRTRGRGNKNTTSIIAERAFLSEDGPKSLAQARQLQDADEWQQAAQEEMDQLEQQGTWKL
ncbi:hypothetical protein FRC00_003539, partial [Tulasnella sp. 408]